LKIRELSVASRPSFEAPLDLKAPGTAAIGVPSTGMGEGRNKTAGTSKYMESKKKLRAAPPRRGGSFMAVVSHPISASRPAIDGPVDDFFALGNASVEGRPERRMPTTTERQFRSDASSNDIEDAWSSVERSIDGVLSTYADQNNDQFFESTEAVSATEKLDDNLLASVREMLVEPHEEFNSEETANDTDSGDDDEDASYLAVVNK
jgi:hypothetical protein